MFDQLDMVRYSEVGLLLVMAVLTATAIASAASDDIALAPLRTAGHAGIAFVVADIIYSDISEGI